MTPPSPSSEDSNPSPTPTTFPAVPREETLSPDAVNKTRVSYDAADSAIKLYLREIGQIDLLTPKEEHELALRIQNGDAEAKEHMIKANLRLVVRIARDYEDIGLPLLDLISEGNIGLIRAVERYDPEKGNKLSTYASWWIKQSIKRALAKQSKTIRLPTHLVEKIAKLRRTEDSLREHFDRDPTDKELAEELGIPPQDIARLRNVDNRPASLDSPILESETATLGDVVRDEKAKAPSKQLEEKDILNLLTNLLRKLPEREAAVLDYRFGLSDGKERTLEKVGKHFNITRERVRQIQNDALAKLRKQIEKLEAEQK